jgi:hypothetical protein
VADLAGLSAERAHFQPLALALAGRDQGPFSFETDALREQIGCFVELIHLARPHRRADVALTDLADRAQRLRDDVLEPLSERFPQDTVRMDPGRTSGPGHYVDACYKLYATDCSEVTREIGDGGARPGPVSCSATTWSGW